MRAPETFLGHQVRELIEIHNRNPLGFCVYRLQGPEDNTGIRIAEDYTIMSLLDRVPTLADAWIIKAEDYYGQYILRVYSRRRDS